VSGRDALVPGLAHAVTGLTDAEHHALRVSAELWGALVVLVGDGPSREADLGELVHHLHVLQRYVLGQAGARAHPELYRLLGETVGP
jgi:hypothetical protein